jgi:hypothetical protein
MPKRPILQEAGCFSLSSNPSRAPATLDHPSLLFHHRIGAAPVATAQDWGCKSCLVCFERFTRNMPNNTH